MIPRCATADDALFRADPGDGIGRVPLNYAKAGRDRMTLHSCPFNRAARRFHERDGFATTDCPIPGADGTPETRMEWPA